MNNNETSVIGVGGTVKGFSLFLAVLHYGFSCLAEGSVPARPQTVIDTAHNFETYLSGKAR